VGEMATLHRRAPAKILYDVIRTVNKLNTCRKAVIDLAKSKSISPRFCDLIGGRGVYARRTIETFLPRKNWGSMNCEKLGVVIATE
jgi:hypothetical protein